MTPAPATFEHACQEAVNRLRAALVELYDSVEADPHSPQDVARRFGLNKTLTWNVSRLIQAPDGLAAVAHVPGRMAIEKMLKAAGRDGASAGVIQRVRAATDAFEDVVEIHLGDRGTLDLVLDSVASPNSDGLERSRKLAFRGNSGLYGIQARAKLLSAFMAPSRDDPGLLDMAMIVGYAGVRRLRSDVRWPLFKPRSWADDESPITEPRWQPLQPSDNGVADSSINLLHEFSSGSLPEMELVQSEDGLDVMLKPGPIGNPGAFDCYRGEYMLQAAGRYRDGGEDTGEFGASISTPVENLVADLFVHEDLAFALDPEVLVFGRLFPHGEHGGSDDHLLLPIRQRVAELPGRPPAVATSLVPRYSDMARSVYRRLDWNPAEFRAVRLQMSYPPLGATVILRFPLPDRP